MFRRRSNLLTIHKNLEKASSRAQKSASPDLATWAEVSVSQMGHCLTEWRRTGDPAVLQEAEAAAVALYAVTRELSRRASLVAH